MDTKTNRSLNVMMIKRILFFLVSITFSYGVYAMSGRSVQGNLNNDDIEDDITCEDSPDLNFKCFISVSNQKVRTFEVKENNECSHFSIGISKGYEIEVQCGNRLDSNFYYYTYNNIKNDWFLSKYEYLSIVNSPDDEGDSLMIDSKVLKSLERSLFHDINKQGNHMISMGYIKKKAYLYNGNYNRTNMYLIKGDKVLILDTREDKTNKNQWYQIYFKGKKDIIAWIHSNDVEYLSLSSKFLTFTK